MNVKGMLLRTRMLLLVALALPLVGASVAVPALILLREQEQRVADLMQQRQGSEMARILDGAARPLADVARGLAADPAFAAAVARRDSQALRALLGSWYVLEDRGALRIEVVGQGNRLLAGLPAGGTDESLLRSSVLIRDLHPGETARGVAADPFGGSPWLTSALRLEGGVLSLASPVDEAVRQLAARLGAVGAGVTTLDGAPLPAATPGFWDALRLPDWRGAGALAFRGATGQRLVLVTTELEGATGTPAARLLVVQDGTADFQRHELLTVVSIAFFVGVVLLTCLLLWRTLRDALDPLTNLSRTLRALASGDIFASAAVPRRNDEVGEIGRALDTLRDSGLALDRMKARERVSSRRDQALIATELSRLASVLDGAEREEADAMLRRLERAPEMAGALLAEAFERMAGSVLARHCRLAELLDARTRDLEVVRAALAERMQLNRLREELEFARHLQLSSLPRSFPEHLAFRVHAAMLPAKEVGGDFYDVLMLDAHRLAILIGDASGKGVGAAMFGAMARSLLRSALTRGDTPAEALALANDALAADNPTMMFATAYVAIFDTGSGRLTFSNAGHNPPLLWRRDGARRWLRGKFNIALGVMDGFDYGLEEIDLAAGDTFLLYTDGVTDALDPGGAFYGENRLFAMQAAPGAEPADLVAHAFADVAAFARGEPQADDITLLCLALPAAAAAPMAGTEAPQALLHFRLGREPEGIGLAAERIEEALSAAGCGLTEARLFAAASEEILVNVANHAWPQGERHAFEARLETIADGQGLRARLVVEDDGIAFDPTGLPAPDIDADLDARGIGGLGVHMVRRITDRQAYARRDGRNVMEIEKRFALRPPSPD